MSDDPDLQPLSPEEGVERFLRHRAPSVRPSTLQNAQTRLKYFLKWCEEADIRDLNDLDGRALADFVAWRRPDLKAITLQKQLSTLRVALRWWADIEAVPDGLAEKVHAPETPDGAAARSVQLPTERAQGILAHLDRYQFASRRHVVMALLWRTGMRRSALVALDLEDCHPDEHSVELAHRPETDTLLKNGTAGERWVYLGPRWYTVVEEYVNTNRHDVTDDYGREPLITTANGRPSGDTIYHWVNEATQPCEYGPCPHDRDPLDCEARQYGYASKCPSARSPHAVRRGAITHHLNQDVEPEVASERMDVSLDVLYQHYDARSQQEKMAVRRQHLPEE